MFKKFIIIFFALLINLQKCKTDEEESIPTRKDNAILLNIDLPGSIQNPAFSPDEKKIIFTNFISGYNLPPSDLYIFDLETESLKTLVSDGNSNVNLPGTSWNSTLKSIVFSSDRDPHDEIFSIAESGTTGDEIRITSRKDLMAYEPSFSPDGKWIVFESHRVDKEQDGIIIRYKTDGSSNYINLTPPDRNCRQPNWSPKGDKILYQSKEKDEWNIWVMNIDGSQRRKITNFKGNKTDAVFTPDGQSVIFSYENEDIKQADIYKVSVSGGTPVQLTNSDAYEGAPAISPDGTKLIFESSSIDPDKSKGTRLYLLNL